MKNSSDENQTLAACTRKGRRGSLGRRIYPGIRASLSLSASKYLRQKKHLSKIIYFECHDFGHYAS